jgi:hypothetical protein
MIGDTTMNITTILGLAGTIGTIVIANLSNLFSDLQNILGIVFGS